MLIEKDHSGDGRVRLGSEVTVVEVGSDEVETYHLVGPTEADPSQGKISHESPLGRALLGRVVGDQIVVHAPVGEIRFRILEVA